MLLAWPQKRVLNFKKIYFSSSLSKKFVLVSKVRRILQIKTPNIGISDHHFSEMLKSFMFKLRDFNFLIEVQAKIPEKLRFSIKICFKYKKERQKS